MASYSETKAKALYVTVHKSMVMNAQRGVEFEVRTEAGNVLMGKLLLSRGGLRWEPSNGKRARKATWEQFDGWMVETKPKRTKVKR